MSHPMNKKSCHYDHCLHVESYRRPCYCPEFYKMTHFISARDSRREWRDDWLWSKLELWLSSSCIEALNCTELLLERDNLCCESLIGILKFPEWLSTTRCSLHLCWILWVTYLLYGGDGMTSFRSGLITRERLIMVADLWEWIKVRMWVRRQMWESLCSWVTSNARWD